MCAEDDRSWHAWAARCSADVRRRAADLVQGMACSDAQLDLLRVALADLDHRLARTAFSGSVQLPALIAQALGAPAAAALDLAARTALLDTGVHCLDDLADGDAPAYWGAYGSRERMLAATMLLAAVPLTIGEMDVAAPTALAMNRTLRKGMLRASAGQQAEFATQREHAPASVAIETIATAKAGERRATYAALAAQLAGATPDLVATYAQLGRATGTAAQIASDCADLFGPEESRDLRAGLCTYPIALALEQPGIDRAALLGALAQARTNAAARRAIVARLRAAHILRRCALVIEYHCQGARQALIDAETPEPERGGLRLLIETLSPLASRQETADDDRRAVVPGA